MTTATTENPTTSSKLTEFDLVPPGPLAQKINTLLHTEPCSFLFHGLFWSAVLVLAFPIAGCALLSSALIRSARSALFPRDDRIVRAKKDGGGGADSSSSLAVYVTGCDTGFGKDLTFVLAAKGFTVFAGCLSETGAKQYEGNDGVVPLLVDVTKDEDCRNAAAAVKRWLSESPGGPNPSSQRRLHAVVNNAGIGAAGLIDWTPLSTYENVMDVNYYGMIRTVKAFLPILKSQVYEKSYDKSRLVNVSSVAGLFAGSLGSSMYSGSKHAVEAFSGCLRLELLAFDLDVVTVVPSSHGTAMGLEVATLLQKSWDDLTPETRQAYGEEYFSSLSTSVANMKKATWNPKYVRDALVSSVELLKPPPQIVVGLDAKYFVLVVRLLPMWAQVKILTLLSSKAVPSCMK